MPRSTNGIEIMPCPACGSAVPQKRSDGRCSACGKPLPEELRGEPEPVPLVSVASSLIRQGDVVEWYDSLRPGDIVLLLRIHGGSFARFGLKRIAAVTADYYPGPKYIVPATWDKLPVLFTLDGWEEYHSPPRRGLWRRLLGWLTPRPRFLVCKPQPKNRR